MVINASGTTIGLSSRTLRLSSIHEVSLFVCVRQLNLLEFIYVRRFCE